MSQATYSYGSDTVTYEMDENGNQRLIVNSEVGDWTWYQGIARCGDYLAVTAYFEGTLDPETPYKLVKCE